MSKPGDSFDEAKEYVLQNAFPAGDIVARITERGFSEVQVVFETRELDSDIYILRMRQANDYATSAQVEELLQTIVARSHWCFLKIRAAVSKTDITVRFKVHKPLF